MRTVLALLLSAMTFGAVSDDPARNASPPPAPKRAALPGRVLFSDDFSSRTLGDWKPDRDGAWTARSGTLKGELPDQKQQHSFIFAGSERWTNYALDLDVCGMRGVDKGVIVRHEGETGIGIDVRGPGYQDVVMHRREWPMGKARVVNANGVWHHLRIEARGHRYRVLVNGALLIDRIDKRQARPNGRIGLAAYTGGVGECTVYYDNVVVTALE